MIPNSYIKEEAKKRDQYKCQVLECDINKNLCAHHILPSWKYPDKRYDLDNIITLCRTHHLKVQAFNRRNKTYLDKQHIKNINNLVDKELICQ